MTVFWCGRSHLRPQRWQLRLVPAGFTSTTRRPASAALPVRMLVNCAQPASRIDLFSPALARAWLGRNVPAFRIRASYLFQLSGLHLVGDALLMHAPCLAALQQRCVIQVTMVGQQPYRTVLPGPRRVCAELIGSYHLHRLVSSV